MKRIATMQDISCIGKCSLTVALPVLSAMGIETAVLPTAVLSTHTMFRDFTFHDLTDELLPIMEHWRKEGFSFEALYTGYLGSIRQIGLAARLFETFGRGKLKLVDPCMADNGKLYAGFTQEFVSAMRGLCAHADIICPNLTEASFLLGIPYTEVYDEAYIRNVLERLTALGAGKAVLTGISLTGGRTGAYAYDRGTDRCHAYETGEETAHFHGTGDLWASTLCGALVRGGSFDDAIRIACEFVRECIALTLADAGHDRYGVHFEQAIPYLLDLLG